MRAGPETYRAAEGEARVEGFREPDGRREVGEAEKSEQLQLGPELLLFLQAEDGLPEEAEDAGGAGREAGLVAGSDFQVS